MPVANFDPARDGFGFANNWNLSAAERIDLRRTLTSAITEGLATIAPAFPGAWFLLRLAPQLSSVIAASVPDGYGLCGGMAFGALDFQRAHRNVVVANVFETRPSVGSPLYIYLWRRLLDSLALNGATFLTWIAMLRFVPGFWPFNGGPRWLLARTKEQVAALCPRLSSGELVPLGLVGETADPFQDHQVLAYDWQSSDHGVRLFIYDMNCPGSPQTIDLDLRGPELAAVESCRGARGQLKGVFCEAYREVLPPV